MVLECTGWFWSAQGGFTMVGVVLGWSEQFWGGQGDTGAGQGGFGVGRVIPGSVGCFSCGQDDSGVHRMVLGCAGWLWSGQGGFGEWVSSLKEEDKRKVRMLMGSRLLLAMGNCHCSL